MSDNETAKPDGMLFIGSRKITPDEIAVIKAAWEDRIASHVQDQILFLLADGVRWESLGLNPWVEVFCDGDGI